MYSFLTEISSINPLKNNRQSHPRGNSNFPQTSSFDPSKQEHGLVFRRRPNTNNKRRNERKKSTPGTYENGARRKGARKREELRGGTREKRRKGKRRKEKEEEEGGEKNESRKRCRGSLVERGTKPRKDSSHNMGSLVSAACCPIRRFSDTIYNQAG